MQLQTFVMRRSARRFHHDEPGGSSIHSEQRCLEKRGVVKQLAASVRTDAGTIVDACG